MAVGLKKRRRVQLIIIGFVLMALATVVIGYAMREGIEFFRSPTQVLEERPKSSEVFRIGGLVEENSLRQSDETYSFSVTDGGASVPISYRGILPDLFGEGQGMIGTGRLIGGVFVADEILAKHDENYMPKEVADALKEQGVYRPSGE
ncbi:cytochrome c-type biogenesis protein CcmE [Amylibacter ulvae]|uniref:Cytochrome c-type biogenesis protein CcmE n=1 Tax=Paramylibacter ulvae TaxID=1651968 RepID=A0ABQ3CTA4_9RHOB|nr:cytochrome c maturation protein CcmE [Amylibacter ulvae]GHA40967.1 cytochrome c-type biogenesis protein CcmE [Amylibacter ulvae]